ncbi:hypothetical protein JW979_10385 [bacterium]|nr:hypothetical protein [candidate division CSSED10-310 bacterium]
MRTYTCKHSSFFLSLILLLLFVSAVCSEETITIGTFNIVKLGETEDVSRISRLAEICSGVDLLAIQEVAETGNGVQMLAEALGKEYAFSVSEITTHERFGFIWRSPVELLEPCKLMDNLNLGRNPYLGKFKAGQFDFEIVNMHLFWEGSKKTYPHTRGVELKLIDDWLSYRRDEELDVILIGDFNEPNVFYGYNLPPPYSFHEMFYELLSRHSMISVSLEKRVPTSIVNQNIYDHIIFNPSHYLTEEFLGFDTVDIRKWEIAYDEDQNGVLSWPEYEKALKAVADHRPVFAKFRIDIPDDDQKNDSEMTNKE